MPTTLFTTGVRVDYRMVECVHCGRQMHSICVLHLETIWNKGFQCETCLKALNSSRKDNKFTAKSKRKLGFLIRVLLVRKLVLKRLVPLLQNSRLLSLPLFWRTE